MYTYRVIKIDRVIDGDTVDAILDLGFDITIKQRLRIIGIDTPELRSRDVEERLKARAAKDFAEKWLTTNGPFVVTTFKGDKYGRMLGDFRTEHGSESFAEAILSSGYASIYGG